MIKIRTCFLSTLPYYSSGLDKRSPQKEVDKKIFFFSLSTNENVNLLYIGKGYVYKVYSIVNWFSFRRDGVFLNYRNFSRHCGETVYSGLNLQRHHHMDTLACYCLVCHMDRYNPNVRLQPQLIAS